MGATGAKALLVGVSGGEMKDGTGDEGIGNNNQGHICNYCHDGKAKPIPDVDGDVSTSKPGSTSVFTVCMRDDMCPANGQTVYEEDTGKQNTETSEGNSQNNFDHGPGDQNSGVSQG